MADRRTHVGDEEAAVMRKYAQRLRSDSRPRLVIMRLLDDREVRIEAVREALRTVNVVDLAEEVVT